MSPFELLGLGPDADLAAVKRAYARLLRTTRPDEDPAGFQRLHSAYQAASALVERRASAGPVPANVSNAEAPKDAAQAQAASLPVKQSETAHVVNHPAERAIPERHQPVNVPAPITTSADANTTREHVVVKRPGDAPSPAPAQIPRVALDLQDAPSRITPPSVPVPNTSSSRTTPPVDHVVVKPPVDVPAPGRPPSARIPTPEVLTAPDLVKLILGIAAQGDAVSLSTWLEARPELWSMRTKQQTGQLLIHAVLREEHTMRETCMDVLLRFFDLDHVLAGIDVNAIRRARHHMHIRWQSLPEQREELAGHARNMRTGKADAKRTSTWLEMLKAPLRAKHFLLAAWSLNAAADLANFINYLCDRHLANLPAQFDKKQAQFWLLVGGRVPGNWRRCSVLSIRAAGIALGALLAWSLFIGLFVMTGVQTGEQGLETLTASTALAGALLGFWMLILWVALFSNWQSLPEYASTGNTWLRWSVIPLLCMAGLGIKYLFGAPLVSTYFLLAVAMLAQRRLNSRRGRASATARLYVYICVIGACFMSAASAVTPSMTPITEIIAVVSMAWWSRDAWRHRTQLKQMIEALKKRAPAR
jgi:hypothetical protein